MFGKKKKIVPIEYDRNIKTPILHISICTGETVAGFKNKETHQFEEVMLIKDEEDLELFKKTYGITEQIKTEY